MAITRRSRNVQREDDVAWFAALIGDECPPDFNPFRYLGFEDAVIFHGRPAGARYADAGLEAWGRLRLQVLAEWRRRKRRGSPPGAVFDAPSAASAAAAVKPNRINPSRRKDR